MFDKEILCPKCGGEIDAMIVMPWSDRSTAADVPAEPYVCSWCASLLIALFTNHGPEFLYDSGQIHYRWLPNARVPSPVP